MKIDKFYDHDRRETRYRLSDNPYISFKTEAETLTHGVKRLSEDQAADRERNSGELADITDRFEKRIETLTRDNNDLIKRVNNLEQKLSSLASSLLLTNLKTTAVTA
jgi:uncharacterized protein YoxC